MKILNCLKFKMADSRYLFKLKKNGSTQRRKLFEQHLAPCRVGPLSTHQHWKIQDGGWSFITNNKNLNIAVSPRNMVKLS